VPAFSPAKGCDLAPHAGGLKDAMTSLHPLTNARRTGDPSMPTRWLIVGAGINLGVVAVLNLYVMPEVSSPILYAAPGLIMSFTESILLVAAVAVVATWLILISFLISQADLAWWPFGVDPYSWLWHRFDAAKVGGAQCAFRPVSPIGVTCALRREVSPEIGATALS
jgi:hypothetical protein